MPGLWFEEREVGQIFRRAIRRTSTEADNVWFSALTHNPAVLHLDEECCRTETEFGRRIVNSAFTLGLMVGISGGDTALGATVANLGRDEVRFPRPLFHNDAPRVESEVLSKRERRSRPGQDVDEFIRRAFNHKGEPVAHCRRSAPMKGRPERPRPAWRKACKRGTVDAAEALRWTSPSAARWRTGCRPRRLSSSTSKRRGAAGKACGRRSSS